MMEHTVQEIEVERLRDDAFLHYWPSIRVEMEKVPHVWDKWWTPEAIFEGVVSGRFQVWSAGTKEKHLLVLVTQIAHYPANTILQSVLLLGNHLEECAPMLDAAMEQWARSAGCTMCEVSGRKGWIRFLKNFGFRETNVTLHRLVDEHKVQ